jgi:DNA-damage-inducible protein J
MRSIVADTYVRARIDQNTKIRATEALDAMGLTVSDAIRLMLVRVADDRCLPFAVKAPNPATIAAIDELGAGKGTPFATVTDLMADLNAED